ncbi:DUF1461 domain-containing protein [Gilvimarinus xylanilyticus]|uniref:DUF1461 domain-containing protein n=1 Tax=Gilvimarinus xylanilyticus TaxID=2944139 RepID=A0A9X2HYN9_9GAMM|nr:DUF1461 domain-containing protein [Gilvimarinus xylanilyticus]
MRLSSVLWPLAFLCHWLVAGFVAWHLLAQVDFAYPQAYQALDIGAHIETYGPQNRYKDDFADTDKEQRLGLFHQINEAIHQDPDSLAEITYTTNTGKLVALLRPPEVVHLQDVAHLIDGVYAAGWSALLVLIATTLALRLQQAPLPHPRHVILTFTGAIALGALVVFAAGPKKVFYLLHTWVFPPEHPWFFYYQDSLMTTLMKAPDLFGFIAVLLLLLWTAIWGISLWAAIRLWR